MFTHTQTDTAALNPSSPNTVHRSSHRPSTSERSSLSSLPSFLCPGLKRVDSDDSRDRTDLLPPSRQSSLKVLYWNKPGVNQRLGDPDILFGLFHRRSFPDSQSSAGRSRVQHETFSASEESSPSDRQQTSCRYDGPRSSAGQLLLLCGIWSSTFSSTCVWGSGWGGVGAVRIESKQTLHNTNEHHLWKLRRWGCHMFQSSSGFFRRHPGGRAPGRSWFYLPAV